MTEKEVGQYKGLLDEPEGTYNGGKKFKIPHIDFANTPIPKSLDWREYGKKIFLIKLLFSNGSSFYNNKTYSINETIKRQKIFQALVEDGPRSQ